MQGSHWLLFVLQFKSFQQRFMAHTYSLCIPVPNAHTWAAVSDKMVVVVLAT